MTRIVTKSMTPSFYVQPNRRGVTGALQSHGVPLPSTRGSMAKSWRWHDWQERDYYTVRPPTFRLRQWSRLPINWVLEYEGKC
jgi:hypothetical protein